MKVIGYGCNPPDRILTLLSREKGLKRKQVEIVTTTPFTVPKGTSYLVFLSAFAFRTATRKQPEVLGKVNSLVFDDPITLRSMGIPYGDFQEHALHAGGIQCELPSLECVEVDALEPATDLIVQSVEVLKQQASVLNRLMTFIYSLPRATHQNAVKEAVCNWMHTKKNFKLLLVEIKRTPEAVLSEKQLQRLQDIVTDEVSELYRTALREGGCSVELSVKYSVSEYEINYMRAIVRQSRNKK